MLNVVRQHYPAAVSASDFVAHTLRVLQRGFDLPPSQILLATSTCADDVNGIQFPVEGRALLGPFVLGGLDGYPFTGATGMVAFAHHVPDDGAALILYGPHIGLNAAGNLGKIWRMGHRKDSGCCGAALLALDRLQNDQIKPGPKSDHDYQQETLQGFFYDQKKRILDAEAPLREATEVVYEATAARIHELVEKTDFLGKYIVLMGVVLINTDWQTGAFLELRHFEVLDARTKKRLAMPTFDLAPTA